MLAGSSPCLDVAYSIFSLGMDMLDVESKDLHLENKYSP